MAGEGVEGAKARGRVQKPAGEESLAHVGS